MKLVDANKANVSELRPSATPEIVARLEKLLECARSGDIVGLVVAYEYVEGGVNGSWNMGPGCRPTNLLGELTRMQFLLASRINDGPRSEEDIKGTK
jgi:hypothetical protein